MFFIAGEQVLTKNNMTLFLTLLPETTGSPNALLKQKRKRKKSKIIKETEKYPNK